MQLANGSGGVKGQGCRVAFVRITLGGMQRHCSANARITSKGWCMFLKCSSRSDFPQIFAVLNSV